MLKDLFLIFFLMVFGASASVAQDIPEPEFAAIGMVPKVMIITSSVSITLNGRPLQEFLVFCRYINERDASERDEPTRSEVLRDQENCRLASGLGSGGGELPSSSIQTIYDFCDGLTNQSEYLICRG